jgi:hypothetical protein
MSGEAVLFIYLGAVGAILLLNAVQWRFYRDWVYGLFTLQTAIWFAHSVFNRLTGEDFPLSDSQNMALYTAQQGLVRILYLGLVNRLFTESPTQSDLKRWLRIGQRGLGILMLVAVGRMLLDEPWQFSPSGRLFLTLYWCLLMGTTLVGGWLGSRRQDVVGWLFLAGSMLLLLSETNTLFNFTGYPWTLSQAPAAVQFHIQILGGGRILLLLCFSLCLVFRQRQIAITQAIEQTRQAEQLIQGRLATELENERLKQEKTQVQLRALQAQVNPHFLFNSLNSLSSLIEEEPGRASHFVDQLSQVYRYVLKANEQPLTSLASELNFVTAYYHLLKTRYGDGLSLTIQVDPTLLTHLLPPLTLQLLIENAVKHNTTLVAQPLQVSVVTDEKGHLVVSNKLQRKRSSVLSNGVGLSTILDHYKQLHQPSPLVEETPGMFRVQLPLIQPALIRET